MESPARYLLCFSALVRPIEEQKIPFVFRDRYFAGFEAIFVGLDVRNRQHALTSELAKHVPQASSLPQLQRENSASLIDVVGSADS